MLRAAEAKSAGMSIIPVDILSAEILELCSLPFHICEGGRKKKGGSLDPPFSKPILPLYRVLASHEVRRP